MLKSNLPFFWIYVNILFVLLRIWRHPSWFPSHFELLAIGGWLLDRLYGVKYALQDFMFS